MNNDLKKYLGQKVDLYNQPSFIKDDPISVPHLFTKKQDIEIAGFFAAIFAWGNRTTIINKATEVMQLMDNAPFEFCLNHDPVSLKKLPGMAVQLKKCCPDFIIISFRWKRCLAEQRSISPHRKENQAAKGSICT